MVHECSRMLLGIEKPSHGHGGTYDTSTVVVEPPWVSYGHPSESERYHHMPGVVPRHRSWVLVASPQWNLQVQVHSCESEWCLEISPWDAPMRRDVQCVLQRVSTPRPKKTSEQTSRGAGQTGDDQGYLLISKWNKNQLQYCQYLPVITITSTTIKSPIRPRIC